MDRLSRQYPCRPDPSQTRALLTNPNWSLSIHSQILADTTIGIAQGTRMAARTSPRPENARCSNKATASPSSVSKATDTIVKIMVFFTAPQKTGSSITVAKFSRPTKL